MTDMELTHFSSDARCRFKGCQQSTWYFAYPFRTWKVVVFSSDSAPLCHRLPEGTNASLPVEQYI